MKQLIGADAAFAVILLGLTLFFSELQSSAVANENAATRPRFALLVGVGRYAHLSEAEQLDGCANDVRAMQSLLVERFGYNAADIRMLVDEQATGAAIRRELQRLEDQVRSLPAGSPQAQVIFHFSGHGSQLPDQEDGPDRDEIDGLDETLVPYDATKQGGPEDLRDDEVYGYVERICAAGNVHMWLVLDCCHSGTGVRGTTKVRKLSRNLDVSPPSPEELSKIVRRRLPSGAIALSACRAHEVEPEYNDRGEKYGLLTRFLVQVLQEENVVSKITHEQLRDAIISRYRQDRSVMRPPVPQLEGDAMLMRGEVLGASGIDRPAYWAVQAADGRRDEVVIKAGIFHGVTVGSLFELYQQPEEISWDGSLEASHNGPSLGWLRVTAAEGAAARADVFRREGDAESPLTLPQSFQAGYAVERLREYGDAFLRLRVVRVLSDGTDGPELTADSADLPSVVGAALAGAGAGDARWLQWVGDGELCDLLLRIDGHYASLFPATGVPSVDPRITMRGDVPQSLHGGWGPIELRDQRGAAKSLRDYLLRITRARNLTRLTAAQAGLSGATRGGGGSPIQISLELLKVEFNEANEMISAQPWDAAQEGTHLMHDQADYAIRVTNLDESGDPIYVTVLHVDSSMGIESILPYVYSADVVSEQRLAGGKSRITDAYTCNGNAYLDPADPSFEPPIYGPRRAIVLATREPTHFYMLAQDSLPTVRGAGVDRIAPQGARLTTDGPSSLEAALLEQVFLRTRSVARRRRPQNLHDDSWTAASIEWLVVPDEASQH